MAYIARPLSTDDFLLFLSMTGSLIFELAVFIIIADNEDQNSMKALGLTSSCLAFCQTLVQVYLLTYFITLSLSYTLLLLMNGWYSLL